MKILQINKYFHIKGGADRQFLELCEILTNQGHEVIPFSMSHPRNHYSPYSNNFADRVDLNQFSLKNIFKIFYNHNAVKKLDNLLKAEKPDIVHLHNIYHQLSPAIINVIKKHSIPVVMTLYDYKIVCPNYQLFSQGKICMSCKGGKYYNCLVKKCSKNSYSKSFLAMAEAYIHNSALKTYHNVDKFLASSNYMKKTCSEFGIPADKIITFNNFVEIPPTPIKSNNSKSYFLYFGRLAKEKGLNTLITTFKNLDQQLLIVGSGPEYVSLKSSIIKKNISNIKLLGLKQGSELQEIINNAKAILVPSIWPENFSCSILEAMALKKVVIASKVGGTPEIIKHNHTGFLFELNNSEELTQIINNLENHNLEEIGQNAKNRVLKLNKQDHGKNILKIYQSTINANKECRPVKICLLKALNSARA